MSASHPVGRGLVIPQLRLSVEVERPSHAELARYDRPTRVHKLQENTRQRLSDLLGWLKQQRLSEQVYHVERPTTFNVVVMDASPEVARKLRRAPGVRRVSVMCALPVQMLETDDHDDDETRPAPPMERAKHDDDR